MTHSTPPYLATPAWMRAFGGFPVIIGPVAEGQLPGPGHRGGHPPVLACELPDGIELVYDEN
jgi:hypothetical protein